MPLEVAKISIHQMVQRLHFKFIVISSKGQFNGLNYLYQVPSTMNLIISVTTGWLTNPIVTELQRMHFVLRFLFTDVVYLLLWFYGSMINLPKHQTLSCKLALRIYKLIGCVVPDFIESTHILEFVIEFCFTILTCLLTRGISNTSRVTDCEMKM